MLAIVPHTSSIADARPAVDAVLRIGAARNLADPYRMGLLLFPSDPFSICDRPLANIRFVVAERIRVMVGLGRSAHHAYDANILLALQQAALALEDDRAWAVAMKRWR